MRDKSFRRHRERVQKKKAEKIVKRWFDADQMSKHRHDRAVGKALATPHPCSCECCGNPRRWFTGDEKLTIQERRVVTVEDWK